MISKYAYKDLIWVDLESPTEEEIIYVMEEFSIPISIGEELHTKNIQYKVETYSDFIYTVLHFPKTSKGNDEGLEQEIDFIIGKNFLITTHYEFIESIHEFSKNFEVDTILEKNIDTGNAGFLFFKLVKTLYINSRRQLHEINSLMKEVESKIFSGKEGDMVRKISNINRMLLDFKQALRFHHGVLSSLEFSVKRFFGDNFSFYIENIISEYNKTQTMLDGHKEILSDLRDTNDSLLANKTEQTMKKLTLITFLISPVAVISNIFVINSHFLKIETPGAYYWVLLLMIVSSIFAYIYIKSKKWL
jgi:magnesium transporter